MLMPKAMVSVQTRTHDQAEHVIKQHIRTLDKRKFSCKSFKKRIMGKAMLRNSAMFDLSWLSELHWLKLTL
jgi:hypothetical protein